MSSSTAAPSRSEKPPATGRDAIVGCLGGGQLGRMLLEAANRLNIRVNILDAENTPAKQISAHGDHVKGSFADAAGINELAKKCSVLTVEIEHVNSKVLKEISNAGEVAVHPSWKTIRTIQDKFDQKELLSRNGIAVAEYEKVKEGLSREDRVKAVRDTASRLGYPFMLKARTQAYDGRGNYPIKSAEDIEEGLGEMVNRELYAEKWADFKMELAVMVIKTKDRILSFPTVETIHEDSICKLVYAPARDVSPETNKAAQELAKRAVAQFDGKGVFGVEMFLLQNDKLLINEIAPRPHNSGHYTIEACPMSQYEAHLCAILDMPIPERSLRIREPAVMLNMLGGAGPHSHLKLVDLAQETANTSIHLYGKGAARGGRKMGHITLTAPSMEEAEEEMRPLILLSEHLRAERKGIPNIPPNLERTAKAQTISVPAKISPVVIPRASPAKEHPALRPDGPAKIQRAPGAALVDVMMGSDSDLMTLVAGLRILDEFDISYTCKVTSAHRTPDYMAERARDAAARGVKVIIAAAGGAAHLPGMVAAHTSLPVIGVPVRGSVMDGNDSLLSIVQMPRGVPVATVGVGNSTNAALLAVRILGAEDESVRLRMEERIARSAEEVREKDSKMEKEGWKRYLDGMKT